MSPFGPSSLKLAVRVKQYKRDMAINEGLRIAGPDTPMDDAYLSSSACQIGERIALGEWTAGAVVRAYVRRAALLQQRFNCLTEVRFKDAIAEADALDIAKTIRGRLHGVPITVADHFDLAGYDTSVGYSAWTNRPAYEDAGIVRILRAEGAIVIAKTNVSQTLLFFESVNPVFGRTSNPWNNNHTCGGSSGGEAALLAADGSALGIGTDIGGSLRIPAFYCGIYSFKPSTKRTTLAGIANTSPGFESVPFVSGPMGRCVEDVDLLARILFGYSLDAAEALPPVPYTSPSLPPRLRFGYYVYDGCIRGSPATEHSMFEAVAALRAAGHEVVEFTPPDINHAVELFAGLTSADGYETMLAPIGRDPKMDELFLITLGPRLPGFLRSMVGWFVDTFYGDGNFRDNLAASRHKTASEVMRLHSQRDAYTRRWYREVWAAHRFDGILAPCQAIPAPPHGATKMMPQLSVSTFLYNLLEFPAGVVPVVRVNPDEDALTAAWRAGGPRGSVMVEHTLYDAPQPLYNAEHMMGLPVAVQVVGRRWEDEKVLAMMRILDDALGERSFGPGAWKP